jgi:hypothetical protein
MFLRRLRSVNSISVCMNLSPIDVEITSQNCCGFASWSPETPLSDDDSCTSSSAATLAASVEVADGPWVGTPA